MPLKRHPHSIRFSQEEWESITSAAPPNRMSPGEFVREGPRSALPARKTASANNSTAQMKKTVRASRQGRSNLPAGDAFHVRLRLNLPLSRLQGYNGDVFRRNVATHSTLRFQNAWRLYMEYAEPRSTSNQTTKRQ